MSQIEKKAIVAMNNDTTTIGILKINGKRADAPRARRKTYNCKRMNRIRVIKLMTARDCRARMY